MGVIGAITMMTDMMVTIKIVMMVVNSADNCDGCGPDDGASANDCGGQDGHHDNENDDNISGGDSGGS